jgi:transposase
VSWPKAGTSNAVDEIYRGKNDKFLTVVSNLETGEPLWFGKERKKETLDEFFRTQLRSGQRRRIEACCVDMWEPFRLSIEEWVPGCRIVYDKFHIIQHANDAVEEVTLLSWHRLRCSRSMARLCRRWRRSIGGAGDSKAGYGRRASSARAGRLR